MIGCLYECIAKHTSTRDVGYVSNELKVTSRLTWKYCFGGAKASIRMATKDRVFKKFTFRGVDLDDLLVMPVEKVIPMLNARQRRKFSRGIKHQPISLLKKLRIAKKKVGYGEKPQAVKTHLRNMTILPEMVGSVVGVYSGKIFVNVEIKPEMIGNYLGEYSLTYKPINHGRAGAAGAKFVP